jgi:hypothetical protein
VWTPTFLVNGAPVSANDSWDLVDWKRLLDPVFAKGQDARHDFSMM